MNLLTAAELQQWILVQLGAPVIIVELAEVHLRECVEQAVRWFAAKKGFVRELDVDILANVQEYTLPDDVDQILSVAFTESALDLSLTIAPGFFLPDQQIPYHALAAPQSAGLYSSFTQSLQYIETAKRVLGIELDWEYDPGRRMFRVFPSPKASGKAVLRYKSRGFTVEQLGERDHEMVKRYALAKAKGILGLIRGKREAIGATGAIRLDGAELLSAAEKEIERLDEEILKSGMPMGILTG